MHRPDVPVNVYQPWLENDGRVAVFFGHRGNKFPSTALMDPMTRSFVADIYHFTEAHGLGPGALRQGTQGRTSPSGTWPGSLRGRGLVRRARAGEGDGLEHPETAGLALLIPAVPRADSGWWLVIPLTIAGCGLGPLVSQLNNYTLSPISDDRVSEAAGVNSAAGSFGLAFADAIMLATLSLSFTSMTTSSAVLSPAEQQQVAHALETDAQIMSNTQLQQQLAGHPAKVQNEIIRINTDARPLALQIALLIPILAGAAGPLNSFRMMRLSDPTPSGTTEGTVLG